MADTSHLSPPGHPASQPRRDRTKPGGFVQATDDFLDVRSEPVASRLTSAEARLIQNLELFARDSCYAYPGNSTLGKRTGRTVRAVQYLLDKLQDKGWILPIMKAEGRRVRLCFLLLKRSNKDRPVYVPGRDDLAEIMAVVFARRGHPICRYEAKLRSAMGEENFAHHGRRKLRPPWAKKTSPESEESRPSRNNNNKSPKPVVVVVPLIDPEEKTTDPDVAKLHQEALEHPPFEADEIPLGAVAKLVDAHGAEWVRKAISEAKAQQADTWGFVVRVLSIWQDAGGPTASKQGRKYQQEQDRQRQAKEAKEADAARAKAEAAKAEAAKAEAEAMPAGARAAEARKLIAVYRDTGADFSWRGSGWLPLAPAVIRDAEAETRRDLLLRMEPYRPEVRAILDAEREAPGWRDPAEIRAEGIAEATRLAALERKEAAAALRRVIRPALAPRPSP